MNLGHPPIYLLYADLYRGRIEDRLHFEFLFTKNSNVSYWWISNQIFHLKNIVQQFLNNSTALRTTWFRNFTLADV